MKTIQITIYSALALPLGAAELTDIAGDWTLGELQSPVALREAYYNTVTGTTRTGEDSFIHGMADEILTAAYYTDPLYTETRGFSLSSGGVASGGETGRAIGISSNRITYSSSNGPTVLYTNLGGDILLNNEKRSDHGNDWQSQTLALKRPASLTTSELAGDWYVVSMVNHSALATNFIDGRLTDTYFVGDAYAQGGDITINSGGSVSGFISGTITGSGPGNASLTTPDGGVSLTLNSSKNVAFATDMYDDLAEFDVIVRKPASLTTSELAGTWQVSSIKIPTTLTETYRNVETGQQRQAYNNDFAQSGEVLVDLFHNDHFEARRLRLMVDAAGNFVSGGTGHMIANGSSVSVLYDGDASVLHPNADKTFMVGFNTFADSQELVLCVKTLDQTTQTFEEAVDLKTYMEDNKMVLTWSGAENLSLEESASISGWGKIEGTDGGNFFVVDPSGGGSRFFRVAGPAIVP